MRALVVYESMYGNTHGIAEAIARGLRSAYVVKVVSVAAWYESARHPRGRC
jgi:flavodoxin